MEALSQSFNPAETLLTTWQLLFLLGTLMTSLKVNADTKLYV